MITAVMLLVCVSSVVRADESGDESSVAAMVKTMAAKQELQIARQEEQTVKKDQAILALTDALLKAKTEQAHVQLTAGGEVVELVSAADVKALVEQTEACAKRNDAQDAEIGMISEELKSGRAPSGERNDQLALELDATKAKLAVQATQIKELSATVAQLLATPQARPMPVDAAETAAAARRLQTAVSPPPTWPPLPATANELRISGRHTAISFNTNVDGVEVFRCVGVSDGKLTCSGELRAADFRTADGISLATVAELGDSLIGSHAALNSTLNAVGEFVGMVPPSSPSPPSYLYLGEGQCRNVDGNSPTWTDRGRMTESACMQAALNANVLPVAIECNGGRPNNCWCQHFTSGPVVQLLPEDGTSAHGTFGCWLLSSPQAPNMALLSAWMSQAAKLHR